MYPKKIKDWIRLYVSYNELNSSFDKRIKVKINQLPKNYLVVPDDDPINWYLTDQKPSDNDILCLPLVTYGLSDGAYLTEKISSLINQDWDMDNQLTDDQIMVKFEFFRQFKSLSQTAVGKNQINTLFENSLHTEYAKNIMNKVINILDQRKNLMSDDKEFNFENTLIGESLSKGKFKARMNGFKTRIGEIDGQFFQFDEHPNDCITLYIKNDQVYFASRGKQSMFN